MSMRSLSVSLSLLLGLGFACDNTEVVAKRMPRVNGGAGSGGAASGGNAGMSGMTNVAGKAGSGSAGVSAGGSSGEGGDASGAGSDFGGAGSDSGAAGEGGAGRGAGGAGGTSGAGSGGMAGSSGNGGNGGTGGLVEPTPECDDGDPCTSDLFLDGACRHDTAPNGMPCDDGDLCTLGDRCVSGECVTGERQSGPAAVLGRVRTYGTMSNSVVVSPGDDRFFFIDAPGDRTRITSTHLADGALATDASVSLSARFAPPVATAFGDLLAVADANSSFSIGGPPRLIGLSSVAPDGSITLRGSISIGLGGTVPAITTLTGSGTRLFVCTNFAFISPPVQGTLHWFDLSDPDQPVSVATGAVGGACGSIAASADATRVYVNSVNGVRIADLSKYDGSGTITFEEAKLVPGDSGLHARGDVLIARSGSELRVFDEPTRTQLSSFTVPGIRSAALTDAGIFVQGDRVVPGGTEFFVGLYDQAGAQLDDRAVMSVAYAVGASYQKPVVGGNTGFCTWNNQLFSLSDGAINPIATPRVGVLNQLFAGAGDVVHSRSRFHSHRIDVSDPLNPSIVAGGPHRNPWLGIKLDRSLLPSALLSELNLESSDLPSELIDVRAPLGHATSTRVEPILIASDEHHMTLSMSFELGAGPAAVLNAGDFIYRAELRSGKVRLRRFSKDAMFQRWEDGGPFVGLEAASLDLELDVPATSSFVRFDVDPVARRAVVGAGTYSPEIASILHVIDLSAQPPLVVHSSTPAYPPGIVAVHGDWIAYSDGSNVNFRRTGSDTDESSVSGLGIESILAFDGTVAYLGDSGSVRVVKRGVNGEGALLAQLPIQGRPSALVSTPNALAVVASGELVTLSPECQ